MKKTIWLLVTSTFSLGFAYTSLAQPAMNVMTDLTPSKSSIPATRSVRNFWRTFGEEKKETWYPMPGGFVAEFREMGIAYKVVYNKKGYWAYTLKQYTEKEMPAEIRTMVKSTWFDDKINFVKEVNQSDDVIYLVYTGNEKESKTIRIAGGEMEVVERCQATHN